MKQLFLFLISSVVLFSCKKNTSTSTPESANVIIKFENKVSGQAIEEGKLLYTNAAGNKFSVSLLKYYVTGVVLTTDDNYEVKLNNYDLIDAFDPQNFSSINAGLIPNGVYKSMRFNLGVDSARNHTGAQDGDLDPIYNMIWDWNTGYLFMKHEGSFVDDMGDTTVLQYHLGTDLAFSTINVPINMTIDGKAKNLNIEFNLNSMYDSPVIDFNNGNIRHSTLAADKPWISNMLINAQDAFTFKSAD